MKNYFAYIIISSTLVLTGQFASAQDSPPKEEVPQQIEKKEEVKPGLSMENPIVCKDIKDLGKVEQFIKKYIKDNYPDYKVRDTMMTEDANERTIEVWGLEKGKDENIESIDLHFDIEDAMIEFRKKNKKLIDELVKDIELIYN